MSINAPDITMTFNELFPFMDFRFTITDDGDKCKVWYKDSSELEWELTDDPMQEWIAWILFHYHTELTLTSDKLQTAAYVCSKLEYIPHNYAQLTQAINEHTKEIS